jgi:hypothetical protein
MYSEALSSRSSTLVNELYRYIELDYCLTKSAVIARNPLLEWAPWPLTSWFMGHGTEAGAGNECVGCSSPQVTTSLHPRLVG